MIVVNIYVLHYSNCTLKNVPFSEQTNLIYLYAVHFFNLPLKYTECGTQK